MDLCPALPPAAGFISSTTGYIDCQARILGSGAWAALAAPGSTLAVVVTGFLTIAVALIGYNLLLGRSVTVREATLTFVKIGAVFALATSWPTYRTLVYDVVTDGPAQLVAEVGPRAGVVGSDGTLVQRLDLADQSMARLAILGPGDPLPNPAVDAPPSPFGGFDAFALGGSRILFDVTAIASLAVVRIVTGLMLALGPFFIAFVMFENTRSLFAGWVRVLGGAALAAIGASIALGLELAMIEPWLSNVVARRMAGEALPTVPTDLFVIASLFAILVTAALYACARVARAFQLARLVRVVQLVQEPERPAAAAWVRPVASPLQVPESEPTRAAALASVLMTTTRRDGGELAGGTATSCPSSGRTPALTTAGGEPNPTVPLGHSFSRFHSRISASAARRDRVQ